jgi:hypothetical protein
MSDSQQPSSGPPAPSPQADVKSRGIKTDPDAPIFGAASGLGAQSETRGGLSPAVWGIAALVVLVAVGVFFLAGRKHAPPAPTTLQPPDAYAASLPFSQLAMSESENLSGGKMTYLDGHVRNSGSSTVTSVTVQVAFDNDEAMPPQIDTVPLALIRMTQPYIDTQPVGADPLKPGDDRAFRLIFESVPENWNQQMPHLRIIHTDLR